VVLKSQNFLNKAGWFFEKPNPSTPLYEEKEIVHDAIEEFAAVNDFFIHAEENYLYVYHSQFNSTGG
jgi:hypothetical protein